MDNEVLLEKMFASKMNIIYKYLVKIGCSPADAEDIVQDTFFKAIVHLETVDPDKMASWLFKVALNSYYDLCRKNKKLPLASLEMESILNNMPAADYLPENYVLDNERKKQVARVLNDLSPVYKNLLVLKYMVELSYREIAELLDISEQTVRTYLYRAKQRFKDTWRGLNYE
ncbi:sigma-70 family RNA polymerase sigma factor [Thermosyntropha sp.]|uniref:RNA polymerase sigma factor n=1 Tax=Thermosyntropha sp. TaxID=2740820 RepID=UPI0025EE8BE9|nr:sigma-70 family RNA polymerase sigma factor [Thermosyntropha sp.]MBO8158951.1 sigma-70 family RNA polymerase sigma factor [Thermosyntropha sp.]